MTEVPGPGGVPTITVITVCYDAETYIEQTIQSVIAQSYAEIEYIIVDGASTDGTLGIIERYGEKIAKWISEPDRGIAEAMNKGLALASGDLILFLHADDYLADETAIERAVRHMLDEHDIYAFNIFFSRSGDLELRRPRGFDWRINVKFGMCHQGLVCRRRLFEDIGLFDPGLKLDMDYDLFLRAYRRGKTLKVAEETLAVMRDTGVSSRTDWPSLRQRFLEEKRIHFRYCHGFFMRGIYQLYWAAYLPYRRLRAIANARGARQRET